eukprot:32245_1
MSQRSNSSLSTLVHGYIGQFQRKNKLFHHFDSVLINLCISYCRTQLQSDDINFERIKKIGRGAFGSIYEIKKRDTATTYAMKQFHKHKLTSTDSVEMIMSERNILVALNSKFVITLKYAFVDSKCCCLILDLMEGGDLKYHLQRDDTFNEERTKFYAAEILLGLEHIHSKGIIYRDLKLENILLDINGHCKISDFGLSVQTNVNEKIRGYAGTAGYVAPESILGMYYDITIDYFSFGVLIYRCLCGSKPFWTKKDKKRAKKRERIRKHAILDRNTIEMEPSFPAEFFSLNVCLRSIVKGLLCKNAKNRLGSGIDGIMNIKQHPWFDSIDFHMMAYGELNAPFLPDINEINSMMTRRNILETDDNDTEQIDINLSIAKQLIGFDYDGVSFKSKSDWFKPGNIVKIYNLKRANEFNDEIAEIVGYFLEDTERWPVQIIRTDTKLAIKTENLRLISVCVNMEYNCYEKMKLNNYTEFEMSIFCIMIKWVKCIRLISCLNENQYELYDDNYYDYIVNNDCIKLIKLFVGKYLSFYDEVVKLFDICTDNNDLKSITYISSEWTLTLYINDNKCVYQMYNGIWNIEGDQLLIEYRNSDNKVVAERFDIWELISAKQIKNNQDSTIFFEHNFVR